MSRYILTIAAIASLAALPAFAETRAYELESFNAIEVSSGIEVDISAGRSQSISVEQRDGKFEDIKLEVEDGVLRIKRVRTMSWGGRKVPFSVTINVPSLTSLSASSGSEIDADGIDADQFRIKTSSGAEIQAAGRCGTLEISASSGADINARDLQCEGVDGRVSSGADIDAYATSRVDASASSGGSMRVFGGATNVDINKSTGGSVNVRS